MALKKYWLEAGTTLFFEKQPNKGFIPREEKYFPSQAVYKAEDVDAFLLEQKQIIEKTLTMLNRKD